MSRTLKSHEAHLDCLVCKDETVADYEAGSPGGRDEPVTVDSYCCQECGTTHVEDWKGDMEVVD